MWNNLITGATVREVGLFVAAYVMMQTVNNIRGTHVPEQFLPYKMTVDSGFLPVLRDLTHIIPQEALDNVLRSIEEFLNVCKNGNVRRNGFEANRLNRRCLSFLQDALKCVKASTNHQAAMDAIAFENDELPVLVGMMDDMLRNMLLDEMGFQV